MVIAKICASPGGGQGTAAEFTATAATLDRRRVVALLGIAAAGVGLMPALSSRAEAVEPPGVSDWTETGHARLRLIDAGPWPSRPDHRLAGLQVQLDPGFITYWRTPGEAGVAPTLDAKASINVAAVDLLFPAPTRLDEGGAEAFGYMESVVFPLDVAPVVPGDPMTLDVELAFAVCAKLCLPASGAAKLLMGATGPDPEAGLVRDAVARVPSPSAIGTQGAVRIDAVAPAPDRNGALVTVTAPLGIAPDLFVETPEPFYFVVEKVGSADNRTTFRVKAVAGPKGGSGVPAMLTLVAGSVAVAAPAHLDAAPQTP